MAPLLRALACMQIRNNESESQFEYEADGKLAVVEYKVAPGKIILTHTEVPKELAGQGIAQKLVTTALDHARSKKLRVVPLCSYVATFIERHPEYRDLVAE